VVRDQTFWVTIILPPLSGPSHFVISAFKRFPNRNTRYFPVSPQQTQIPWH